MPVIETARAQYYRTLTDWQVSQRMDSAVDNWQEVAAQELWDELQLREKNNPPYACADGFVPGSEE